MAVARQSAVPFHRRGAHALHHAFIPHAGNGHHPLVVRPRALKIYSVLLVLLKLGMTGFLYAIYPTQAHYAELTTAKILELTNESRAAALLPALTLDSALTRAAEAKAADMLERGYFEHTNPGGKKFWQWIREAGYDYTTAGENLAMDFTTAESAHTALMASPSHRANVLKETYAEIGLAVAHGSFQGTGTIMLVEMFGTPLPDALPTDAPATETESRAASTATPEPSESLTYTTRITSVSDASLALLPGSTADVWIDYKNTGTATWRPTDTNFLALNVANPAGRTSAFANDTWIAPYRPATLTVTVAPGETGRVRFSLTAPARPGAYEESFALVAEGSQWLQGSEATIPITVVGTVAGTDTDENAVALPSPDATLVEEASAQPAPLTVAAEAPSDWRRTVVDLTQRTYWAFFVFLTLSLLLAVLVRIRIQHKHLVVQTLAVIMLASVAALVKFHFLERLAEPFVR